MNDETNKKQEQPKNEGLSIVEEAAKIRDEIRAENDRRERILKDEQSLKATTMLAGTTGGHVEAEVKEETPKEYADKIMSGRLE